MKKNRNLYELGRKYCQQNKERDLTYEAGYYLDLIYKNQDIPEDEKNEFLRGWRDVCEECKNK